MSLSIPSITELMHIFFNESSCDTFLIEKNIYWIERKCPSCEHSMHFSTNPNRLRCRKKTCRKSLSIKANSFFSKHKLPTSTIMLLGYFWLVGCTATSMIKMSKCSKNTVVAFRQHFRQLVSESINMESMAIGGDGIEVEIDETKLGKRKYNRGHPVEGVWIVGGVERTSERRVFMVPVENRTSHTLSDIIANYVKPGSIILTDMWKGYSCIQTDFDEFEHKTVNHSKNFKDPQTGVHTNTIEGTWNGLKMNIKSRNRVKGNIEFHLFEFIWRRQNKDNLWDAFLLALSSIYYE